MNNVIHTNLAQGRWQTMSLAEQLGNVGSEVSRANRQKDEELFWQAVARGLELLDLTIADKRWLKRARELTRAKEILCDAVLGGKEYGSNLGDIQKYFDQFALLARAQL